jgi:uncharacterized protein (DUF885 family)
MSEPTTSEPTTSSADVPGDAAFVALAQRVLESMLESHPEQATLLGDHRFDDRLLDARAESRAATRDTAVQQLAELEQLQGAALSAGNRVDAEILGTRLRELAFEHDRLRDREWDPLVWNPGTAIHALLARDFAPLGDRLRSVAGRLRAVPALLEEARRTLGDMPRVHVETAIGQFTGTRTLLAVEVERSLSDEPALRGRVDPARAAALEAVDEHLDWLRGRLPGARRDPRLGADLFTDKLALALDTRTSPDELLRRAEADLARVEQEITETAARIEGGAAPRSADDGRVLVRRVLDRLAAEGAVDDDTIVAQCEQSLREARAFVHAQQLVTVPDDPVRIIVMPEIHRGVAVAYCDPPGPLEPEPLPTYFAVAPTPGDWPPERVASFYREYNAHMVHNLTVHEGVPGHVLQLAHSRRLDADTPVRKAFWSGPFVEGWAVYAEELMAEHGYRDGAGADALRMQQLKMQLRMVINAILDVRVHVHGMTEDEAMRLMLERGQQEEGEAAGKWRRALLSSAQLSTYYVGYTEVSQLARDVAAARPDESIRARHDAMLAHGSPPPRHLRTLLLGA